jgi:hypothetical protein
LSRYRLIAAMPPSGHLVEREHAVEAIRADGTSVALFSTAVAAAQTAQPASDPKDRRFDSVPGGNHAFLSDLHIQMRSLDL